MPRLGTIGRWSTPDAQHLILADPSGNPVLTFAGSGSAYTAQDGATIYVLEQQPRLRHRRFAASPFKPTLTLVASKEAREPATEREKPSELAGRYAVLREKRDTGCMVTLDASSRARAATGRNSRRAAATRAS